MAGYREFPLPPEIRPRHIEFVERKRAEQLQRRREEERQREGRKNQKRDTPRPPCLRNPVRLEALRSEKRENVRQSFIVPDPRFEEL